MLVFCAVTIQVYAATSQADYIILDNKLCVPKACSLKVVSNKFLLKNRFVYYP